MADKDPRKDYLVTEKLVKRFDEALAVDEVNLSIKQRRDFCPAREFGLWQVNLAADAGRV
jgi:hypothetical protein